MNALIAIGQILDQFANPILNEVEIQRQQVKVLTDKLPKKERVKVIKENKK